MIPLNDQSTAAGTFWIFMEEKAGCRFRVKGDERFVGWTMAAYPDRQLNAIGLGVFLSSAVRETHKTFRLIHRSCVDYV